MEKGWRMDGNNKILIGFVVLLVGFLGFPVVMNKMKQQNAPQGTVQAGAVPAAAPTLAQQHPELAQPPMLNEQSLINTEWQAKADKYVLKITLAAGGICYVTHPMMKSMTGLDYIEGRWSVNYDKMHFEVHTNGMDLAYDLIIAGPNLYSIGKDGKPSPVQRFR